MRALSHRMNGPTRTLIGLLAMVATAATGQEASPQMGRFMPLYPGFYGHLSYLEDARDSSYDAQGIEQPSAAPQSGRSTFDQELLTAQFLWHFPMFESQHIPFFSSRTHLARVTLRHGETSTSGALASFVADGTDDARSEADDLVNSGSGLGDTLLEFGSFLYGSATPDWRTRKETPIAVLLLLGVNVPTGVYGRDAPNNIGSNTWFFQGKLGLHWQSWPGGMVELGAGWRDYLVNEEPQFGGNAPWRQGDDLLLDASLSQRIIPGVYASLFTTRKRGEPNLYRSPWFSPNAPPHPDDNTDSYPVPGLYEDNGTDLYTQGFSVQWFPAQRWLVSLQLERPTQGRSGQFLLPHNTKSPSGCMPGAQNCNIEEGETILVDGLGPARAYASERTTLSVTYQFGQGNVFTCTGCGE